MKIVVCNACVFYKIIFSNKLNLLLTTCSIIVCPVTLKLIFFVKFAVPDSETVALLS